MHADMAQRQQNSSEQQTPRKMQTATWVMPCMMHLISWPHSKSGRSSQSQEAHARKQKIHLHGQGVACMAASVDDVEGGHRQDLQHNITGLLILTGMHVNAVSNNWGMQEQFIGMYLNMCQPGLGACGSITYHLVHV